MGQDRQPETFGNRLPLDFLRTTQAKIALVIGATLTVDVGLVVEAHGGQPQPLACAEFCGETAVQPMIEAPETHHSEHRKDVKPAPAETPATHHSASSTPTSEPTASETKPSQTPTSIAIPNLLNLAKIHVAPVHKTGDNVVAKPDLRNIEGNDIGWPQCKHNSLPHRALRILGLSDRHAKYGVNPCLGPSKHNPRVELPWAANTEPNKTMYYSFVVNHGPERAKHWPKKGKEHYRNNLNPYHDWQKMNGEARNWQLGWQMARRDNYHLEKAARDTKTKLHKGQMWFVDEEGYSYHQDTLTHDENARSKAQDNNRAVLEGMVSYIKKAGYRPGIYSWASAWDWIIGRVSPKDTLYDLPEWQPTHGVDPKFACYEYNKKLLDGRKATLTGGGETILVQDQEMAGGYATDHDTGC